MPQGEEAVLPRGTGAAGGGAVQLIGSEAFNTLNPAGGAAARRSGGQSPKALSGSGLREFFELFHEWHPTCLTQGRQLARVSMIPPTLVSESKGGVAGTESQDFPT